MLCTDDLTTRESYPQYPSNDSDSIFSTARSEAGEDGMPGLATARSHSQTRFYSRDAWEGETVII